MQNSSEKRVGIFSDQFVNYLYTKLAKQKLQKERLNLILLTGKEINFLTIYIKKSGGIRSHRYRDKYSNDLYFTQKTRRILRY